MTDLAKQFIVEASKPKLTAKELGRRISKVARSHNLHQSPSTKGWTFEGEKTAIPKAQKEMNALGLQIKTSTIRGPLPSGRYFFFVRKV